MMKLEFDLKAVAPLIEQVVIETLRQVERGRAGMNGRLAFREAEAAALLGVKPHVLRDARYRGELEGSLVGKRVCYTRENLEDYLRRTKWTGPR